MYTKYNATGISASKLVNYQRSIRKRQLSSLQLFTARVRRTTGRYCFHRCLSVNIYWGTYLPRMGEGVPTLDGGVGTYLGWGKGVPWMGEGYLPWMGGGGTYLRWGGGGTYLGWGEEYLPWMGGRGYLPWMGEGGTCLGWGRGYLPWMGGGVPTLDGGRGYLPWMGEGVPTLDGGRGYLPFTGYAAAVCLLHSCRRTFLLGTNLLFDVL